MGDGWDEQRRAWCAWCDVVMVGVAGVMAIGHWASVIVMGLVTCVVVWWLFV